MSNGSTNALLEIIRSCGHAVPIDSSTLNKFTKSSEYCELSSGEYVHLGLENNLKRIRLLFNCFVCDAPAESLITGTKGHCGFYGCGTSLANK